MYKYFLGNYNTDHTLFVYGIDKCMNIHALTKSNFNPSIISPILVITIIGCEMFFGNLFFLNWVLIKRLDFESIDGEGEVPLKESFRILYSFVVDLKVLVVDSFDVLGNILMSRFHRNLNDLRDR